MMYRSATWEDMKRYDGNHSQGLYPFPNQGLIFSAHSGDAESFPIGI